MAGSSSSNSLNKYIWLVDAMRRNRRITLHELNQLWMNCELSGGKPLARRSFYTYRGKILEIFGIEIGFNPSTNEYFIKDSNAEAGGTSDSMTDWILESTAMSGMLSNARSLADRIFLESVPSAQDNLAPIIDAMKADRAVRFTYRPFNRTLPSEGIVVEPYLLKLFRQRWYVAGRNIVENKVKTYALDRITNIEHTTHDFKISYDFNPATYFANSFGIVVDSSNPRTVILRADARQAKYLRALPLHPSQEEMIHDDHSMFHYRLQLTPDFLQEIMSLSPFVTVVSPPELRTMLTERLRQALALYE